MAGEKMSFGSIRAALSVPIAIVSFCINSSLALR